MNSAQAGRVLGMVGRFVFDVGAEVGGAPGMALQGAGALARKLGVLLDQGQTVETILKAIDTIPDIHVPWRDQHDAKKDG